jgi:hypothetical protein
MRPAARESADRGAGLGSTMKARKHRLDRSGTVVRAHRDREEAK